MAVNVEHITQQACAYAAPAEQLRVLLVEDRETTRGWLAQAVEYAFEDAEILMASDLKQAHHLLGNYPSVALVDLNLPDGSGIEVIQRISSEHKNCTAIVATIYDDDEHLFAALKAGARGYLLKDQEQEDIARLLQRILVGEPPLSPGIAQRLLDQFHSHPAEAPDEPEHLTSREMEVLGLIAKGYNSKTVGKALEVSPNTIAYHIKNIYRKLEISSRAEAVLEATRMGLLNPSC